MRVATGALLLLLVVAAGCEEPAARPARPAPAPPARETATTIAARRVTFDGVEAGVVKAKVGSAQANAPGHEDESVTYWVYDVHWAPVGFFTPGGQTFRVARRGSEMKGLGTLPRDVALRVLLGAPKKDSLVDLLPMQEPRTLDGDREAAQEAAAKAAKEKAKAAAAGEAPAPQ